ncbi:SCO family protein [Ideonella sp. A 288]|uniref:SCO family protein n=1 Tax=Ideonella sp. A 288 TaxID=1962181 RepID=UPI000B4B6088|nr:SCO family protein [Ideonella sp. A 288]
MTYFSFAGGLRSAASLAVAAGALATAPVLAQHDHHKHQDHSAHTQAAAKPVVPQSARISVSDTPLVDQDGRNLKFKSDALGDRIVIVNFAYTTCTTVCPVVTASLAQVQGKLGARVGRDVGLVTVTVDPLRDTPTRLKAYAGSVGAGAGWTWLTGPKPQVDEVLKAFGAYTVNFLEHPPLVLVGDAKSGKWVRFYGLPTPDQLVNAVTELSAARVKAGTAG